MQGTVDSFIPFVRYLLFFIGAKASSGDMTFIPEGMAEMIANDPLAVQTMAGWLVMAGTVLWYTFSKARKALIERLR